jgi:hypothetical protein
MISPEKVLPTDELLDVALDEFREPIADELHDLVVDSVFGEIIDWTLVGDSQVGLADRLGALLGVDSEPERQSVTRAALFARQTLMMIYGGDKVVLPLGEYCGDSDTYDFRERVEADTAKYLADNEHVAEFITQQMQQLDQGRGYGVSAAKIMALIFMMAEYSRAEQYLTASFESVSPAMFE